MDYLTVNYLFFNAFFGKLIFYYLTKNVNTHNIDYRIYYTTLKVKFHLLFNGTI